MGEPDFAPHWFGNYELLRRIGMGGMAEVFLARSARAEGFEKVVVVKRMLPRLARDTSFVDMFVDEARLAVKLQHANVVQILSLESHDGLPFIVMEHVHGRDLADVLRVARARAIQLPVDFGIYCLAEMLKGLHYAHSAVDTDGTPLRLVHRDVTPSNIFLSFDGEVKLGDFGVAHAAGSARGSQARGKYSYLAPEVLTGTQVDARSDVFSAGVVLWEVLAQRPLFAGESAGAILYQVQTREPEPPSSHNPQVPFELDVITIKALQKDPATRFQSAAEFEEALSEFLFEQRKRWTPRRLAAVMREVYPEACRPLLLPPPSVPSVMGNLLGSATGPAAPPPVAPPQAREDALEQTLTRAMGELERTPTHPAASWEQREPSIPGTLEPGTSGFEDPSAQREAASAGSEPAATLALFAAPGQAGEVLPLEAALERLAREPASVAGLGADGRWELAREEFGRLACWDTLTSAPTFSDPAAVTGRFEDFSVTRLLYELTLRRMSGALLLTRDSGSSRRILYVEAGVPVYVSSDRGDDGAPALLLRHKLLPPATVHRSLVRLLADRLALDAALLSVLGARHRATVERALAVVLRTRLEDALSWPDGGYQVFPAAVSPVRLQARLPSLLGVLVRGVRRAMTTDVLEAALYGRGLQRVVFSEERRAHVAWLRLQPDERRVVDAIDDQRSLPQILAQLERADPDQLQGALATLYVLAETHLVELL